MFLSLSRRACLSLLALPGAAGLLGAPGRLGAAELPAPADKPILTITGKIETTNKGGQAQFDRAMLEGLGTTSFVTTTPWDKAEVRFEGVPMARVMEAVGATGTRLLAVALNDYTVEIPIADFAAHNVLLAMKRDGEYMTVRNKGPLFIIYPFDSNPELKKQQYYSRSAWQVARIEVK